MRPAPDDPVVDFTTCRFRRSSRRLNGGILSPIALFLFLFLFLVIVLVLSEAVLVIEGIVKNRANRFASRARAPSQATEHEHEHVEFRGVPESCTLIYWRTGMREAAAS